MKITLFTSNKNRHNYLINLLSGITEQLFVVQESEVILPSKITENNKLSPIVKKYFQNVNNVQSKLFGNPSVDNFNEKIKILPIRYGDLNHFREICDNIIFSRILNKIFPKKIDKENEYVIRYDRFDTLLLDNRITSFS